MKENLQVRRVRCDMCKKAVFDTELKISEPYFVFDGMGGTHWQQGEEVRGGYGSADSLTIYTETSRGYTSVKEFCSGNCFRTFLMKIADEVDAQEAPLKMERLKE